jgi:hypothetical protein
MSAYSIRSNKFIVQFVWKNIVYGCVFMNFTLPVVFIIFVYIRHEYHFISSEGNSRRYGLYYYFAPLFSVPYFSADYWVIASERDSVWRGLAIIRLHCPQDDGVVSKIRNCSARCCVNYLFQSSERALSSGPTVDRTIETSPERSRRLRVGIVFVELSNNLNNQSAHIICICNYIGKATLRISKE